VRAFDRRSSTSDRISAVVCGCWNTIHFGTRIWLVGAC
jgi:hypothetical protein